MFLFHLFVAIYGAKNEKSLFFMLFFALNINETLVLLSPNNNLAK